MGLPIIEAEKLSKRYFLNTRENPIWALDGVSFLIGKGEIVGLLGKNGSGKSTLLKILSKITDPTSGRAIIRGRVSSLLEVGTGFHPDLTGKENVYLNGAILGLNRAEIRGRFRDIAEFSEIENFLDTPVKFYSSGMYTRLAFAVAAHLQPEILFIDEILSVGDINFQRKCLEKIVEISKTGKTVFFTSHNVHMIETLTSRCLFLDKGKLVMDAPASETVEAYLKFCSDDTQSKEQKAMIREYSELKREVEFVKLDFDNVSGAWIPAGENLKFRITLTARENVDDFRLSMTVFRQDGHPAGSFFGPQTMSIRKGEQAVFAVEMEGHGLTRGLYFCAAAVGKGDYRSGEKNFDIVKNVLHFEITEKGGPDGFIPHWSPSWGSVRFKTPKVTRIDR